MKKTTKKITSALLAILCIFSLSVCAFGAIGLEQAKEIALKDAGFSQQQISIKECKKDGRNFDIEFFVQGSEYDYSIDSNGSIVSFSFDSNKFITGSKAINAESAKSAALGYLGLNASSVKALSCEYDAEDVEYEVKFISGSKEYSVTVSAVNAEVVEYEYEVIANGNSFIAKIVAFFESLVAMIKNLFVK